MKSKRVSIKKIDLGRLIQWAEYGIGKARSGSCGEPTKKLITTLEKRYWNRTLKPEFGKYIV